MGSRPLPCVACDAGAQRSDTEGNTGSDASSDGVADHVLPETWQDWAPATVKLLKLPRPPRYARPLQVATPCSGTDAPVHALEMLVGKAGVNHVFSVDNWSASESFILHNFTPAHFYGDVADLLNGKAGAACSCCKGSTCSAYQTHTLDVLIMGFPCKPYSALNMRRWADGYDPFQDPNAGPFFNFRLWLGREDTPKPRCVILENVGGLLQPFSCSSVPQQYKTPLDYILRGVSRQGTRKIKHGLEFLPEYAITHLTLDARHAGLPMRRRRVFIVMIRRDLVRDHAHPFDAFHGLLSKVKSHPLTALSLEEFVHDDPDGRPAPKKAKTHQPLSTHGMSQSTKFRQKHGLPPMGSKHGSPFSRSAPPELLRALTERETELCNCVFALMVKKLGHVPESLSINVSESLSRAPWKLGSVRSVSTHSKIYFHKTQQILNVPTLFQIFGWCPRDITFPDGMAETALRVLVGNMMAVPTVGVVELLAAPRRGMPEAPLAALAASAALSRLSLSLVGLSSLAA